MGQSGCISRSAFFCVNVVILLFLCIFLFLLCVCFLIFYYLRAEFVFKVLNKYQDEAQGV